MTTKEENARYWKALKADGFTAVHVIFPKDKKRELEDVAYENGMNLSEYIRVKMIGEKYKILRKRKPRD